jgi:hypothetical protein
LADKNAPFTPTSLNCEIVTLFNPAALSKVRPIIEAPKSTRVIKAPLASKMFTASLVLLKPTPDPP